MVHPGFLWVAGGGVFFIERKRVRQKARADANFAFIQISIESEPIDKDYPPFKDGLPQYVRLKNVAVTKKLAGFSI
jgi:hypothetical protein